MSKSFEILLGIAGLLFSVGLSAEEKVPAVAVADHTAYVQPIVERAAIAPPQFDFEATDSPADSDRTPNPWICVLGFLGVVILRRTRSGPIA
ncbi:MAG TPA: hypothetical protein VKR38_08285 [Usitatibacter sp.]|nr:hypothetical protein [Usitatibacter sp.]